VREREYMAYVRYVIGCSRVSNECNGLWELKSSVSVTVCAV